ncbi:extracellular catalytic domain type 1 short-chain-length polyhydroxyalkanoate depolymerase [Luteimonas salinisoli]|uniref:extracellular catalytic domain type 1 short-chain-length polyhydroxyalkanoate depolymerase n=1 Tax=Luteimonas salinisoli TaxID=2752307 RepID=UPI001C5CBD64
MIEPIPLRARAAPALLRHALACLLFACAAVAAPFAFAQAEVTGFGSNPGNLRMFKHVPAGLPAGAPLVVALHGCAQSASSYDAETGWQMLADRWQFALLLPQQQGSNNASACFNWFELGDTARGQGEALSIKQMVDRMLADHGGDPSRVYATGLSAGGAMTAVMLAAYPDVFAGGAILSGVPYRCATSQSAAFGCMNPGTDLTPAQWGDRVRSAHGGYAGPWPIVSIWHGDADYVVRPANLAESMEQWTDVHGIDQIADASDSVAGYPHRVYEDASGTPRVETYTITGMGHGAPVDPGSGESQCGTAGAYILDAGICASYYIGHFWGLDDLDGSAPDVVLTAPADGAEVGGTVALAADASDDIGIARVEFLLDGVLLGSDDSAPYGLSWDSTAATDGAHTLQARAIDLVDNVGTSAPAHVNVVNGGNGGVPQTAEFSSEAANDGYVKADAGGGSPAVGTLEAYFGLAIGRGTDGKYNRSLLSFDTSALPDAAIVVSATLTVRYNGGHGDPWANPPGNALVVDAHPGCVGTCATEGGDYAAAMAALDVARLQPFSGGSQTSNLFDGAGLAAINRHGHTQLRLRFSGNPAATGYVWIGNGASAKLTVEYLP